MILFNSKPLKNLLKKPFSIPSEHLFQNNIDDLEHLIQSTKTDFGIIAASKSIDISIPNYSYKFCPTKTSSGKTLIYTRNHL